MPSADTRTHYFREEQGDASNRKSIEEGLHFPPPTPPPLLLLLLLLLSLTGLLSEDTVAKVKVLGKGDSGLTELEKYIPMENIPEFLGGKSRATVGPTDPLWLKVDAAMAAWAVGEDPFLEPREIRRVSTRIRRERAEAARAKAETEAEAEAEAKVSIREMASKAPVQQDDTTTVTTVAAGLKEEDKEITGGVLGEALVKARGTVRRSREKTHTGTTSTGRSKRSRRKRRQSVGGVRVPRRRHGHSGSSKSSGVRMADISGDAVRPWSPGTSDRADRKAVAKTRGVEMRSRRRKEAAELEQEEAEAESSGGELDGGIAALAVGESAIERLLPEVVPVLRAVLVQVVAAGRLLLSVVETVFCFLRGLFFEQVEVEEP